ncbi:MAG: hypothetical protein NTV86_08925 [Planctomycetota bacterium]|nr:hypothetical protein [Planctomycetota bacterium]
MTNSHGLWRQAIPAACVAFLTAALAGQTAPADKTPPPKPQTREAAPSTWDSSELAAVKLGSPLAGPDADVEAFRGNVVVIVMWQPADLRSVASLDQLKRFYEAHRAAGLAVIAGEGSGMREKAAAAARALKPSFPVVAGLTLPMPEIFKKGQTNRDGKQLTALVYDHTGTAKAAFPGFSVEAQNAALKYLALRPHPLLGAQTYKKIAPAVALVRSEQYGSALKYCKERTESDKADEDTKAEASALQGNLETYADRLTKQALDKQSERPSQTVSILTNVRQLYRGSAPGEEAGKQLAELLKDKAFQTTLEAEKEYLAIRSAAAGIPTCPSDAQEKKKWQGKFAGPVREIRKRAVLMKKKFGDIWHTQQAEAIATELEGA